MSSRTKKPSARRKELIEAIFQAGRENSAAGVFFHNAVSDKLGLSITDQKTIDILLRLGPLTAGEIGKHTGLATASVTGLIDRLEKRGYARRVRDTKDRRRVFVEVDAERLSEVSSLFDSFGQAFGELLLSYSDEELEVIHDFLSRSANSLREETATLTVSRSREPDAGDPRL